VTFADLKILFRLVAVFCAQFPSLLNRGFWGRSLRVFLSELDSIRSPPLGEREQTASLFVRLKRFRTAAHYEGMGGVVQDYDAEFGA